jgi:hypothetical protein
MVAAVGYADATVEPDHFGSTAGADGSAKSITNDLVTAHDKRSAAGAARVADRVDYPRSVEIAVPAWLRRGLVRPFRGSVRPLADGAASAAGFRKSAVRAPKKQ